MTNEEKAKAYDEAIKKAKEIKEKIVYSHLSTESCKAVSEYIDTIIPELRGSEDEKIRRTLAEYFGPEVQLDLVRGVPIQKIRDWLERQKEQKPAEKQDYSGLNDLERVIHRAFLCAGVENVPVTIIEETAWECLAQMKPAEWSEEEEGLISLTIAAVEDFYDKSNPIRSKIINLLKSLRPQPHWKPSKEQISSLKQARDYYMSGRIKYIGRHLSEIAEQLEKLM